jgi:hypothetical protein
MIQDSLSWFNDPVCSEPGANPAIRAGADQE